MFKDQEATRVLIVDDERTIADTLTAILNMNGFQARAVYSGLQAVEAAGALNPQFLIVDVIMNGMNGVDAAVCVCEGSPDCRVILFSGQPVPAELIERAHANGRSFEMLMKPLSPQAIIDHLNGGAKAVQTAPH